MPCRSACPASARARAGRGGPACRRGPGRAGSPQPPSPACGQLGAGPVRGKVPARPAPAATPLRSSRPGSGPAALLRGGERHVPGGAFADPGRAGPGRRRAFGGRPYLRFSSHPPLLPYPSAALRPPDPSAGSRPPLPPSLPLPAGRGAVLPPLLFPRVCPECIVPGVGLLSPSAQEGVSPHAPPGLPAAAVPDSACPGRRGGERRGPGRASPHSLGPAGTAWAFSRPAPTITTHAQFLLLGPAAELPERFPSPFPHPSIPELHRHPPPSPPLPPSSSVLSCYKLLGAGSVRASICTVCSVGSMTPKKLVTERK
ncbi:translation initiation factor IF-2-like [Rissa tridactyla]|uniref:translation initiation factor IF-2-like n=1 Tax=Rissa tridactyla TaxID=75485 RepID=UPI0023BAB698|nr:translation initiation factor IF-2-like [Rissa tridactyla]